jgi:uncharacterized protein (TIGR03067 family)
MRTALLLAAVSGLAVFSTGSPTAAAPVPKHLMKAAENPERDKLRGRWKLTGIRVGGQDVDVAGALDMALEFRGDDVTVSVKQAGNDQAMTAKVKLDTADGVKRIVLTDSRVVAGNAGNPGREGDGSLGYVLDGDTLTVAARQGAGGQQAADPANPGKDTVVMVLTRVKTDAGR